MWNLYIYSVQNKTSTTEYLAIATRIHTTIKLTIMEGLKQTFAQCKKEGRVGFLILTAATVLAILDIH
jgi:hypothetical protein